MSTYAIVSFLFWYVGLIPDLATLRDRTQHRLARALYGFLAMGWRFGAALASLPDGLPAPAGLATPLVVGAQVSLDFAASIVPGWHATVFPPYLWPAPSMRVLPW